MGNRHLNQIPISNFIIKKPNDFIPTPTDPDKLKEGMKLEKKNINKGKGLRKIIDKHLFFRP